MRSSAPFCAEYDHPKVLYMPQATLTLPLVKE